MRVMIVHPHLGTMGGVQTSVQKLMAELRTPVRSFALGRPGDRTPIGKAMGLLGDLRRFRRALRDPGLRVVHVNASLKAAMFFREGLFCRMARKAGKRIVLQFHGWDRRFEALVDRRLAGIFRALFSRPDVAVVLARDFERALQRWGHEGPIELEVSTTEDEALEGFDLDESVTRRLADPGRRVLFISRVVREKGIYEAMEAVELARASHPRLELVVVGEGPELEPAKRFARSRNLTGVRFLGRIEEKADVREVIRQSHLLFLPTYYGEGFPAVIPEAMIAGLPVLTRPVGGIGDALRDGEHGFLTESRDPAELSRLLESLLTDEALYRAIARANHDLARSRFLASAQARRFDRIYESLLP